MSLGTIIDGQVQAYIALNLPGWYMCPDFGIFLNSTEYQDIKKSIPLRFATGLAEDTSSTLPPGLDFLKTLRESPGKSWGVYALVLEKEGEQPALYVGSGTHSIGGCPTLLATYKGVNKEAKALPRFVRYSLSAGFHLAHCGLLCWSNLPPKATMPKARLMYLAIRGHHDQLIPLRVARHAWRLRPHKLHFDCTARM